MSEQKYGPRQVFQWSGPDEEMHTVEVVGTVDADGFTVGHIVLTVRDDVTGDESRLDLDVTNARAMRDAIVAATDWVCDNAEDYS